MTFVDRAEADDAEAVPQPLPEFETEPTAVDSFTTQQAVAELRSRRS